MELYIKKKEIPGLDSTHGATKEEWIALFDAMNLSFDYMVEKGFIKVKTVSTDDIIFELHKRILALEEFVWSQ